MLNFPAPRTQIDGKQREYSLKTRISSDPKKDKTRQELREEADINWLLKRYTAGNPPPMRDLAGAYDAHVDYDLDSFTARNQLIAVNTAYEQLPPDIRERYPSWPAVYEGIRQGEIVVSENGIPTLKTDIPAGSPPTPTPAPEVKE